MGKKSRAELARHRLDQSTSELPRPPLRAVPVGWGDDAFSTFCQVAHENAFGVFIQHRSVFDLLVLVHETFDVVSGIAATEQAHQWRVFFVTRAHSGLLAAARLAMSGQVVESFAPLRLAIETAWYGLHASIDPDETKRMELWLRRDDNEEAKRKTIKEFRAGEMKATHTSRDPETAAILGTLYERCITLGAHPNLLGFLTSMIREEDETTLTHKVLYLNVQLLPLMNALKTIVEVAVSILRVFGLMYPREYVQAGVLQRLEAIIEDLNEVFRTYARTPAN